MIDWLIDLLINILIWYYWQIDWLIWLIGWSQFGWVGLVRGQVGGEMVEGGRLGRVGVRLGRVGKGSGGVAMYSIRQSSMYSLR